MNPRTLRLDTGWCVHCGYAALRCPRGCGRHVCAPCGEDHVRHACTPTPRRPERYAGYEDFAPTSLTTITEELF